MATTCEYAKKSRNGMEKYILCELTKEPCAFQRYCVIEDEVINTDGAKTCVAKNSETVKKTTRKKTSQTSEKGLVTLVTPKYIVYEYNGNSCFKNGKFDVSVGDEIDV